MNKALPWMAATVVLSGVVLAVVYALMIIAVGLFVRPFADLLMVLALAPCE